MERPFDLILMADLNSLNKGFLKKTLDSYSMEHSHPIKYKGISKIKTISEDIAIIDKKNLRLRHGEEKLSKIFVKIIKDYVTEKKETGEKNPKD